MKLHYLFLAYVLACGAVSAWLLYHPEKLEAIYSIGDVVYFDEFKWLSGQ